ncbi:hypothetical protein NPIL_249071 [Nephila pilipes]|uniref:Uncharacterized protein n=1 Tax=Nephila pilipes TaxID=299642 RepID=A0A8X6Q432_NEPPI|nr:hypothetical protein NPIL_249071 [Nephila pilipes]
MERHLKPQNSPSRKIERLCDRCLSIWYNLSSAIFLGLVALMPRHVATVLSVKGGPKLELSDSSSDVTNDPSDVIIGPNSMRFYLSEHVLAITVS